MSVENYLSFTDHTYKRYKTNVYTHKNLSLNYGLTSILLIETQRYLNDRNIKRVIELKSIANLLQKNIRNCFRETSFFLGPLGVLWGLLICEKALKINLFKKEDFLNEVFLEYYTRQLELIGSQKNLLDYIYGIGAWFVIFPYLNNANKELIKRLYSSQLENFDFENISKVEYGEDNKIRFSTSNGVLGFSHGISSIAFLLKNYYEEKSHKNILERITMIINENFDNHKLARNISDDDYERQDWCHGNLGVLTLLKSSEKKIVIDNYFNEELDTRSHGLCHGLGQRILLPKIMQVLNIDSSSKFNINDLDKMNLDIESENLAFIQHPLITEMALLATIENLKDFSWWRMFYPVNSV